MKPAVIAQMLLRLLFVVQAILGIVLLATNGASPYRGIHVLAGVLFVICMWIVAGANAGRNGVLAAIAALWGLLVLIFGLTQDKIAPGSGHWVIDIAHPLAGIIAIGLAEMLAARPRRQATTA